ncbi:MAG: hypothetical protein O2971_18030 [Proteobacteria bacterium]|nr:hypothetical protein [Pseudomonadota bacterium]
MRLRLKFLYLLFMASLQGISDITKADDSFVVSGPLDYYYDYVTGVDATDHNYSSTITYDSSTPLTYTISEPPYYAYSKFNNGIISIEYKIYNASGIQVASGESFGFFDNETSVQDDLGNGHNFDYKYWYAEDFIFSAYTKASTLFRDHTGQMVTSVTDYPTVPAVDDFDFSVSIFRKYDYPTGEGHIARGPVTEISDVDPVADCKAGAKNHGQFVNCVAKVTNDWRKAGDITGKEKGILQSDAAQLKP